MNSEVRIRTQNWRVSVVIGVCSTVIVLTAMILFWTEFKIILLGGAGITGFTWLMIFRQWLIKRGYENTDRALDLRIKAATAAKAEVEARFLVVNRTQRIIHSSSDDVRVIEALPDSVKLLPESTEPVKRRSVFDLLSEGTHFALFGGTQSGKTTLANHLADKLGGDVIVCDPHSLLNTWTRTAQVVGGGDYQAIAHTIGSVRAEMLERYKAGSRDGGQIVLILDEWPAIVDEMPDTANDLKRISREAAKVNIRLILLSQSDLVSDLGTNSSIRDNFIKIALTPELTRQNQGTIRHWDKSIEVIDLAGPYHVQGRFFNRPQTPALPDSFERDVAAGMSNNKLVEKYYSGVRRTEALGLVKTRKNALGTGSRPDSD